MNRSFLNIFTVDVVLWSREIVILEAFKIAVIFEWRGARSVVLGTFLSQQ